MVDICLLSYKLKRAAGCIIKFSALSLRKPRLRKISSSSR
jgi:hypothetical protein